MAQRRLKPSKLNRKAKHDKSAKPRETRPSMSELILRGKQAESQKSSPTA